MKKIVAHFIATNFYGGPERQIIFHSINLKKCDCLYDPIIISFKDSGCRNELLDVASNFNIRNYSINIYPFMGFVSLFDLFIILKMNNVSILICHGYKANVIGRLVSLILRIPIVVVSRGWTSENLKIRVYEKLDKLFLRLATHIVAVSEGQRQKILCHKIRSNKVTVIHNAIDLKSMPSPSKRSIRKQLGIPQDAIFVCTAGRLSPEKNQVSLVEAARSICLQRSDVFFCIFGEGVCRSMLEAKIKEYRLEKQFHLPGFQKNLLELFHEIDIFTLPSLTEGLPNVILEAYAWRKPVVATRVGGTPEVVQHGRTGFLYDPHDVYTLAEHLLELSNETEKRLTMGDNGYEFVCNFFNYCNQTELYIKLYERLS